MAKEIVKKGKKNIVVEKPDKPADKPANKPTDKPTEKIKEKAESKVKSERAENQRLLEERVLAQMKTLGENGIKEFTSTLLRDKLGLDKESGRDQVRKIMHKLEKEGKVAIAEKAVGKRKQYVYSLKA